MDQLHYNKFLHYEKHALEQLFLDSIGWLQDTEHQAGDNPVRKTQSTLAQEKILLVAFNCEDQG